MTAYPIRKVAWFGSLQVLKQSLRVRGQRNDQQLLLCYLISRIIPICKLNDAKCQSHGSFELFRNN